MPDFSLQQSAIDGVPILHLGGDLSGSTAGQLDQAYRALEEADRDLVLLECGQLRYVNSSGIAGLLGIITHAVERGQRVDFVGVPPHLRRVMDLIGMTDYVGSFDTAAQALAARSK